MCSAVMFSTDTYVIDPSDEVGQLINHLSLSSYWIVICITFNDWNMYVESIMCDSYLFPCLTFGPSFPGLPTGPLIPGSPCLGQKIKYRIDWFFWLNTLLKWLLIVHVKGYAKRTTQNAPGACFLCVSSVLNSSVMQINLQNILEYSRVE